MRQDGQDRRGLSGDGRRRIARRDPDGTGRTAAKKTWNTSHKLKISLRSGRHAAAGEHRRETVAVAHAFASNGKILAVTGPAGSQEIQDTMPSTRAAGLAQRVGLGDPYRLTRAKNGTARETAKGYFFRDGSERWPAGRQGRVVHPQDPEVHARLDHRRRRGVQPGPRRPGAGRPGEGGSQRGAQPRRAEPERLLVVDRVDPGQYAARLHPVAAGCQGADVLAAAQASGKTAKVMGSDGIDVPGQFEAHGAYVSGFPVEFQQPGRQGLHEGAQRTVRDVRAPVVHVGPGQRHRDPDGVQGRPWQDEPDCSAQGPAEGEADGEAVCCSASR